MASIYELNETMAIVGCQSLELLTPGGLARKDFANVMRAHKEKHTSDAFDIACDFFILGVMYGKKLERHKKDITEITPLRIGEHIYENKR